MMQGDGNTRKPALTTKQGNRRWATTPRSHRHGVLQTTFRDIDFGEDDANLDFEIALRRDTEPVFIKAFYQHPQINFNAFSDGIKYIIIGQKGTGKTAILRKLSVDLSADGALTDFMIFRDEIASKEELDKFAPIFAVKVNDVKKLQHHLYVLERILLLLIASKLEAISNSIDESARNAENPEEGSALRKIINRVICQPVERVVQVAFDTINEQFGAIRVDVERLSKNMIGVDPAIALRKQNERLLDSCILALKKSKVRIAVFIDEIHYSYRTDRDHEQDVSLVRDLIRAVTTLNRKFAFEKVRCTIYAAIRSEYLSHPLLSAGEVHNLLSAFGTEISWATFPANFHHPMFDIGARRVDIAENTNLNGRAFMRACFANFTEHDARDFVESTWSKPRDMVRFLRTCKEMYPDKVTLSKIEYAAVFRAASKAAWKEVETALTSFLSIEGIQALSTILTNNSSQSLEHGNIGSAEDFKKILAPVLKYEKHQAGIKDADTLYRLLYLLGVIYTTREVKDVRRIMHSYHRGQSNPDPNGKVAIHRAVAKAFS
jgi:hypothetical protein